MGKLLLLLSFISLLFVAIGSYVAPSNPVFWLASGSGAYQQVRVILSAILFLQLVTRPPRSIWFRILSGAIATAVAVWVVEATYAYHMLFLDSLAFLAASIAMGGAALERKPVATSLTKSSDIITVA